MDAVFWYMHISVLSRLKYSGMWCHSIWCVVTDILKGSRAKRLFDLKVMAAHSMLWICSDHTSSVTVSCRKSPKCSGKLLQEFQISSLFVVCLLSLSLLFVYCHCQYYLFTVTVSILEYCLEVVLYFWCQHIKDSGHEIAVSHWKWFLMFVTVLFVPL